MDRIVPLDQLDDLEVTEGRLDVRGWSVRAADGRRIGEVDNLLVDTAAMRVRYLDVSLDVGLLDLSANQDRHILIPIGYARLDEEGDEVLVDSLDSAELAQLPVYSHEPLTREYEARLRQRLDVEYRREPGGDSEFYADELFDDARFFGRRRGQRGGRG